ncbi:Dioxygenase [Aquisphaera giovannonii]|uniref:Dioxygenase n=1 Tax=Aquisphaera giovannonii TaxID=406548 RepID=A0A5B9W5F1_9BACT|nr:carboxypeptidase regulatory-like domain-containing protein [Aquisphaera giovannonii]QEH35537.1 Dioxygenase [Aquisphaera giovannonii]
MVIGSLGMFVALVAASQVGRGVVVGEVVDAAGRPVAGAEVALAAGTLRDGSVPVLAAGTTDGSGRFHLRRPPGARAGGQPVDTAGAVWIRKDGFGLGVSDLLREDRDDRVHRVTLEPAAARRVTVVDEKGAGIPGVRIAPRIVVAEGTNYLGVAVPDAWLDRLAAEADAGGVAEVRSLGRLMDVRGYRATIPGRGAHTLMIPFAASRGDARRTAGPPVRLASRIADDAGRPIAGASVEVWVRTGVPQDDGRSTYFLMPERLPAGRGPSSSGPDGTVEIPDGPLRGSSCRLVARAEGFEAAVSGWVALSGEKVDVPVPGLRRLRTVEGRVVDRGGAPVVGASVFTQGRSVRATTDAVGRFRLEGVPPAPTFLFASKEGFRFRGRMLEGPGAHATIELARADEPPARIMRTLPDPIPLDESRGLARRVLDPALKEAIAKGDDASKLWLLRVLRWLDPPAILEQVERIKVARGTTADYLKGEAALGIAPADQDEAASVAETIADRAYRAGTLVDLADAAPSSDRARKLALLDRAAEQARAAEPGSNKYFQMGEVAEHWLELGEREKARAMLAEGFALVRELPPLKRTDAGSFLGHMAWLDPKAAVELMRGVGPDRWHERILANIAIRAAHEHPAEAEEVLNAFREPTWRVNAVPRICRRMAGKDPDRARRIAASQPVSSERAYAWTFLALGLRASDPAASREALDRAVAEIDAVAPGDPRESWSGNAAASILPLVEELAPDVVEEVFWHAVALQPADEDPREDLGGNGGEGRSDLPLLLSRYDRAVAATLLAPVDEYLRGIPNRADGDNATPAMILAVGAIDPRRAVEVVEGLPKARSRSINDSTNWARQTLSDQLAMPPDRRWMRIWRFHAGCGIAMFEDVYRDL